MSFSKNDLSLFLYSAISHNDYDAVKKIIEEGVDINQVHKDYCYPPFMHACTHACYTGITTILEMIFDAKADISYTDGLDRNALVITCCRRDVEIDTVLPVCETLLKKDKSLLKTSNGVSIMENLSHSKWSNAALKLILRLFSKYGYKSSNKHIILKY